MTTRYLTTEQVCQRYGIKPVTLYRWEHNQRYAPGMPKPIRINRRKLWAESELELWEIIHRRPRMDTAA